MDLIASITIFVLAIALVMFSWSYASCQNQQQAVSNMIEKKALSVSDALIRTRGFPENWNTTTVIAVGLASEEGVLNTTKVSEFIDMDCGKIKHLLGIENYNFYFEINDTLTNAAVETEDGKNATKGEFPAGWATAVVPIERYVLFGNRPAKMRFILWQ